MELDENTAMILSMSPRELRLALLLIVDGSAHPACIRAVELIREGDRKAAEEAAGDA